MENVLILLAVAAIVGGALWYIRREKKRGAKCVGCPDAKTCGGNCGSCGGCGMK